MSDYKYILQPYKGSATRFECPQCGQKRAFVKYIDTETGEYLANNVGRCNRESNCGYHYTPKQYYRDTGFLNVCPVNKPIKRVAISKPLSFIPSELYKKSLGKYDKNNFLTFLIKSFGVDITLQLIEKYKIGTSKYWKGATVFWQIDIANKIRSGKIMLYDSETGKRIKEPFSHITWVHKALKYENYNLQQCFFGEHLLPDEPIKPIAIVESEKTALIASVFIPDYIWLASGSLNNINPEKCKILVGRNVVLFPDLNAFKKWQRKADELAGIINVKVSDYLERIVDNNEIKQGFDLADYLIPSLKHPSILSTRL